MRCSLLGIDFGGKNLLRMPEVRPMVTAQTIAVGLVWSGCLPLVEQGPGRHRLGREPGQAVER